MLLTDLRALCALRYRTETLTATEWYRWLAMAVREYSRWAPRRLETTFTTVYGQSEYDLVTGCVRVLECEWPASAQALSVLDTDPPTASGAARLMPSLALIDDVNDSAWALATRNQWEQWGTVLHLDPLPQGAETVRYRYSAVHVLNADGTGYDTIPDEDLDLVVDLALAELLTARAQEAALEPDYRLGLASESYRDVSERALAQADALRKRVIAKYGGPVALSAP
jgi:hypothetical protein